MQIQSLQEKLESRAEKRFNNDWAAIEKFIRSNPLLNDTSSDGLNILSCDDNGNPKTKPTKPYWFFQAKGYAYERIKKIQLPIYIQEEINLFLKDIEDMKERIDEISSERQQSEELEF